MQLYLEGKLMGCGVFRTDISGYQVEKFLILKLELPGYSILRPTINGIWDTQSVFHLPKNSGNFGWDVNGTRLFGLFPWKFSGINGIPAKVVPFSWWKLPNGKIVFHLQISRLYHQFHAFCGLLSSQDSFGSLMFQQKWRLIRVSFLEAFCKQTLRATMSALPATF